MKIELTAAELRNGWTPETLAAYRAERESQLASVGAGKVGGNVITEFKRPKPAPTLQGVKSYNPHRW